MAKDHSAVPSSPLDNLRLALAEADFALAAVHAPEEARTAALLALKAIYDFLKVSGLKSRALNNLSMALQDVERGHCPKLFAPLITHRPPDKAKLFILKATSAAAMQTYMDSGKTKSEAAALVATGLDTAGYRQSGRDPKPASARTVARWRDRFTGHSDAEGADNYEFVLQQVRAIYAAPVEQAAHLMQGLKGLVRNLDNLPS